MKSSRCNRFVQFLLVFNEPMSTILVYDESHNQQQKWNTSKITKSNDIFDSHWIKTCVDKKRGCSPFYPHIIIICKNFDISRFMNLSNRQLLMEIINHINDIRNKELIIIKFMKNRVFEKES